MLLCCINQENVIGISTHVDELLTPCSVVFWVGPPRVLELDGVERSIAQLRLNLPFGQRARDEVAQLVAHDATMQVREGFIWRK